MFVPVELWMVAKHHVDAGIEPFSLDGYYAFFICIASTDLN